jgi:hypothetical protein
MSNLVGEVRGIECADERLWDLIWLARYLRLFGIVARNAYPILGRGVVVIDATVRSVWGRHPWGYLPLADVELSRVPEAFSLAQRYDPEQELVAMIVKGHGQAQVYRLRVTCDVLKAGNHV